MPSTSVLALPSTPSPSRLRSPKDLNYLPMNSSPLATPRTPVTARRRASHPSRTPHTPLPSHSRIYPSPRIINSSGGSVFASGSSNSTPVSEDPRKNFLRDKFKARCIERAAKARQMAIQGKRRYTGQESSDGFDETMDDDEDEDDDDVMREELFRRIVADQKRRAQHEFRVSYARSVASSDLDLEHVLEWEQELTGESQPEDIPLHLDDDQLEAYAEEYAFNAAVADFEDVPYDELFGLEDEEGLEPPPPHRPEDVEMAS